jgi:hypothetical protein
MHGIYAYGFNVKSTIAATGARGLQKVKLLIPTGIVHPNK